MKESFDLSKKDRRASDSKVAEAELILKEMDKIKQ